MTNEEMAKAVKKARKEEAKLSPDERFQQTLEHGISDAKGRVVSESLGEIEDLLKKKGFHGISAFHIGDTPGGAVKLHEKVYDAREATGPYDTIRKMIKAAPDEAALWQALEKLG